MTGTAIEWAHHTANIWSGCVEVSQACVNCYAKDRDQRFHQGQNWGPLATRPIGKAVWKDIPKWQAAAESAGGAARVFCGSLMDIGEAHRDEETNASLRHARQKLRPYVEGLDRLHWLFLTKRPHLTRWLADLGWSCWIPDDGDPRVEWTPPTDRAWLGVTVEDPKSRWRLTYSLRYNASVHFASVEPILGRIDLEQIPMWWEGHPTASAAHRGAFLNAFTGEVSAKGKASWWYPNRLGWVIIGGESGPKARPWSPVHVAELIEQCRRYNCPVLFKQQGNWQDTGDRMVRHGSKHANPDNRVFRGQVIHEVPGTGQDWGWL